MKDIAGAVGIVRNFSLNYLLLQHSLQKAIISQELRSYKTFEIYITVKPALVGTM